MFIRELLYLLTWISPVVLIIGVIIGSYYYKQLDQVRKLIFVYLIGALLFDILSRVIGLYFMKNNLILIPLFSLFELPMFTYIYARHLTKQYAIAMYIISSLASLFIINECFTANSADLQNFQSYSRTLGAFLIVLYSLTYYIENFFQISEEVQSKMRINTLILGFFSLNLIFLLPINFLINASSPLRFYLLFGNLFLTIVFYLTLTISLWRNGKTQKP